MFLHSLLRSSRIALYGFLPGRTFFNSENTFMCSSIIRATKCSLRFATQIKREILQRLLTEYAAVVNQFVDNFWEAGIPAKKDLNSTIYSQAESWLSPTMKQIASREAVDMIRACRERDGEAALKPLHTGRKMQLTQQVVKFEDSVTAEFDHWLTLSAIAADRSIKLTFPVKRHKHWNGLERRGFKRLNSYVVTPEGIQFAFKKSAEALPLSGTAIGLDTGINSLATLSDGTQYGRDIKTLIERAKGCKWGSNGHKRAQRAIKQRICEVAKSLFQIKNFDVLVVEDLKNLGHKTKQDRRVGKSLRRSIGAWNWRLWLGRLSLLSEENRVRLWKVAPHYTSQKCRACGHTCRGNRSGELFLCQMCGYTDNADHNASENILDRFTMGIYGSHYQGAYRSSVSSSSAASVFAEAT